MGGIGKWPPIRPQFHPAASGNREEKGDRQKAGTRRTCNLTPNIARLFAGLGEIGASNGAPPQFPPPASGNREKGVAGKTGRTGNLRSGPHFHPPVSGNREKRGHRRAALKISFWIFREREGFGFPQRRGKREKREILIPQ